MDYPQKVNLLDAYLNLCTHNNNLPDTVIASTRMTYVNDRTKKTYNDFLELVVHQPKMASFLHTTNNRQLNIFNRLSNGGLVPRMPRLTIDKLPRPQKAIVLIDDDDEEYTEFEYVEKWDPEKWNIADTGEQFILGGELLMELDILPKQEFNIFLSVKNLAQIDKEIAA